MWVVAKYSMRVHFLKCQLPEKTLEQRGDLMHTEIKLKKTILCPWQRNNMLLTHSLAEPARGRRDRFMAYKQPSSRFTHL